MTVTLRMRALLLADRLDTKDLAREETDAADPAIVRVGGEGRVFLFRQGVAVFSGLNAHEEAQALKEIATRLRAPLQDPSVEEADLVMRPEGDPRPAPPGAIALADFSTLRLSVVAEALAKAATLNHLERIIEAALNRVEPLAQHLMRQGRPGASLSALNTLMGEALMAQHRMLAQSQTTEKPEALWDHPELERLYARLQAEYELNERAVALDRKFDLLRTATAALTELIQNRHSHILDLTIIALIAFEIVLSLLGVFGLIGR